MFRCVLIVLLIVPTVLLANERDARGYEQLLLPVFTAGPRAGAFGSIWVTELHARNEGAEPIQVFQSECAYFCDCPGRIATCAPGVASPPRSRVGVGITNDKNVGNTGVLIYASRTVLDALVVQLHTRDISRAATNFGTEIPVVREPDFRRGATSLLNVPVDGLFRQHLRIFGISSPSGIGEVVVRLYELHGVVVLAERRLVLVPGGGEALLALPDERPALPAYAEIPHVAQLLTEPLASGRIRIEVDAVTPGLVYWPFVAIVNNTTQHLTLVTPQ